MSSFLQVNNELVPWYVPKRITLPKHSQYYFHDISSLKQNRVKAYLRLSKVLDFTTSVRAPIHGLCETEIPIFPSRKRMTESMKWSLVAIACDYGASDLE